MCDQECRHELFEVGRSRAGCTITQLWVDYLALGGMYDLFAVEAYLHGLAPLPAAQQDVLASALNERLDDVYRAAVVPYLNALPEQDPSYEDAVQVIDQLLDPPPADPR